MAKIVYKPPSYKDEFNIWKRQMNTWFRFNFRMMHTMKRVWIPSGQEREKTQEEQANQELN